MKSFVAFMAILGVEAGFDNVGLGAVSNWFERCGGLLLHFRPRSTEAFGAFVNHQPAWTGKHVGINLVWDIGLYVGECVIARRQSAGWEIDTGDPDPISRGSLGFHRPCVAGLYWPPQCDPISMVFFESQSMSYYVRAGSGRRVRINDLVGLVALWSKANPANPGLQSY
jgi:hypothetical protein